MKSIAVLILAAAVGLSVACKSKDGKDESGGKDKSGKPVAKTPGTNPVGPKKPTRPAPKPIDQAAVNALVTTWLDAQNKGDFAAYETVFAKRMTGVKRVGSRTTRYDRAGWLKDRKRMFKKKMTVSAAKIMVTASAQSAVVRFTQTWASGTYKDVGPKQLLVVRQGKDLRIAREEMLESMVMSSWRKGGDLDATSFAFVIAVDKKDYVVVAKGAKDDWSAGPIALDKGSVMKALQKVDMSKVPADIKAWHKRKVTGYGGAAKCEATLGDLFVMSAVTPHFGARQTWSGEMGDDPATLEEIAEAVKGMVPNEDRWVLARLSGCKASWVRAAGSDVPVRIARKDDPELSKKAIAAFRKLAGWTAIQKELASYTNKKGPWDGGPKTRVFEDARDKTRYVFVWASAGEGCGQFEGSLWAAFSADSSGRLLILTDRKDPGVMGFTPSEAWDLDGQGDIGFVGKGSAILGDGPVLIRFSEANKRYEAAREIKYAYQDSPC